MAAASLVEIGPVVGAHGVTGEFKVRVSDPRGSCLLRAGKIHFGGPDAGSARVIRARPGRGTVIMRVDTITDRNGAEAMRGRAVLVDEGEMPVLAGGEYYFYQLEGLTVRDKGGRELGFVEALSTNGAQDLLVIKTASGGESLVPFVSGIVVSVDLENRVVTLDPPEGLMAP